MMDDTAGPRPRRRELAHRKAQGLDVWLEWDPRHDEVYVLLHDTMEEYSFELYVPDRAAALDAFHHPFAHACGSVL